MHKNKINKFYRNFLHKFKFKNTNFSAPPAPPPSTVQSEAAKNDQAGPQIVGKGSNSTLNTNTVEACEAKNLTSNNFEVKKVAPFEVKNVAKSF